MSVVLTQDEILHIYGSQDGVKHAGDKSFGFQKDIMNYVIYYQPFLNIYEDRFLNCPVEITRNNPEFSGRGRFDRGAVFCEETINLIYNPDFSVSPSMIHADDYEAGSTGWTATGWTLVTDASGICVTLKAEDIPIGKYVSKISKGTGTGYTWAESDEFTIADSTNITISAYVKANNTGATMHLYNSGNTPTTSTSVSIPSGNTWTRVSASSATPGTGADDYYQIRIGYNAGSGTSGDRCFVTCIQAEVKDHPTSFDTDNTDGSSTRYASYVSYKAESNIAVTTGSTSFWFTPNFDYTSAQSYATFFDLYYDASNYWRIRYVESDQTIKCIMEKSGTVTHSIAAPDFVEGDDIHIALVWDGDYSQLFVNGTSGSTAATNDIATLPESFYIGVEQDGTHNANGIISDFAIFNKKLTVAEVSNIYNDDFPIGEV